MKLTSMVAIDRAAHGDKLPTIPFGHSLHITRSGQTVASVSYFIFSLSVPSSENTSLTCPTFSTSRPFTKNTSETRGKEKGRNIYSKESRGSTLLNLFFVLIGSLETGISTVATPRKKALS